MVERWRIKICLVGDSGVGKSSLIRRFVQDQFDDRYVSTLGAKASKKEIPLRSTKTGKEINIVLTIFDIMGSPSLRDLLKETYFNGVEGILAVCDLGRPDTLYGINQWAEAVARVAGDVPMVLLGNKADLREGIRLTPDMVQREAERYNCPWYLTSAKTGENVEKAFKALMVSIIKRVANTRTQIELEYVE
jgi:small GTP-binding protein